MTHPGTSKIIRRSKLKPEWRDAFLTAKYFTTPMLGPLAEYANFFDPTCPTGDIEKYIVELLDKENIDYVDKQVEYWFQQQRSGASLSPHCDYNYKVRSGEVDINDMERVMSPVTLACYLQVESLEGGDLCVSEHSWFDEPDPLNPNNANIMSLPYERITPQQDEVLYFEGAKYYHWIDTVRSGIRKSMLINFWPRDL